jgi:plasmid stabilization system protein ParE
MAKRKIIWSDFAKKCFEEILDYYFKISNNKKYSNTLSRNIKSLTSHLKDKPFLGKRADKENLRVIVHDIYKIYYEVTETQIEIIVFWDSRRNPEDLKKLL